MDIEQFRLVRLTEDHDVLTFDCGNFDLNDFLINDAKAYNSRLLAVTYLLETGNETAAFFSMINDKNSIEDVDSKTQWRKYFRDIMPQGKRFKSYPAVKLGRLGVSNNFNGQGIGTLILDYLKELFITNNRTGCKYITADAYSQSLNFYERNGFKYLTENDKESSTRLMYFDLMTIRDGNVL